MLDLTVFYSQVRTHRGPPRALKLAEGSGKHWNNYTVHSVVRSSKFVTWTSDASERHEARNLEGLGSGRIGVREMLTMIVHAVLHWLNTLCTLLTSEAKAGGDECQDRWLVNLSPSMSPL